MIPMNGKKVSGRELRRRINAESALTQQQIVPAVNQLLTNDRATHAIVEALRKDLDALTIAHHAFTNLTFAERVRWVIRGVR